MSLFVQISYVEISEVLLTPVMHFRSYWRHLQWWRNTCYVTCWRMGKNLVCIGLH